MLRDGRIWEHLLATCFHDWKEGADPLRRLRRSRDAHVGRRRKRTSRGDPAREHVDVILEPEGGGGRRGPRRARPEHDDEKTRRSRGFAAGAPRSAAWSSTWAYRGCGDCIGVARFAGPFVKQPKISTGGDHFNAGAAWAGSWPEPEESLCRCSTSGYYVRSAHLPFWPQASSSPAASPEGEMKCRRVGRIPLARRPLRYGCYVCVIQDGEAAMVSGHELARASGRVLEAPSAHGGGVRRTA